MKHLRGINEALDGIAGELTERENKGRPPKAWFKSCLKKVKGDDPNAICGNIWANTMGPAARKRVKKRGTFEAEDAIDMMTVAGEMMGEEPDLEEALSKRHFVRVAEILKRYASVSAVREIAQALAAFFAEENPQFDEKRFLAAAGAQGAPAEMPLAASADDAAPRREQGGRLPWSRDPELGDLSV